MKLYVILILLNVFSCTSNEKKKIEKLAYYESQVRQFSDSLTALHLEYEKSQVYLLTAETHQVTRSPEEKDRQLGNLKGYRDNLEERIQIVEGLISNYTDSLAQIK